MISAECWLTSSAAPGPSVIEGTGLFAVAPISAGDLVSRLGGRLIDDAALAGLKPPYSSLTVGTGLHLLIDRTHPVSCGNHSCDPNIWHTDAVTIIARRDIAVGEEITIDYATHTGTEGWTMACRCLSSICRRTVTGQDWRLSALRRRYGLHWSPALLSRIAAES